MPRPGSTVVRFPKPVIGMAIGACVGVIFVLLTSAVSPLLASGLLVGLVVVAALFLKPVLALSLTFLVIPLERFGRFTNDSSMYTLSLMRIVGVLTLLVLLLHVLVKKKQLNFGLPVVMYAGFTGMALLSITYTSDFINSVKTCGAILGNLLFFFLIVNMVRTWSLAKLAILIWLTSSVLIGVYTIYDWHFKPQMIEETELGKTSTRFSTVLDDNSEAENLENKARASGPTSHPAVYGINLILTLPFFAYLIKSSPSRARLFLVVPALLVILYNILLTNTRAVLAVAIIVLGLCVYRGLLKVTPARIAVALLLLIGLLPLVPADVYDRILDSSNYTYERSKTLRVRMDYWKAGLRIIEDNWLIGIGVGNQITVPKYINYSLKDTSVHNEYLETMIELGIIGWLMFFGFVALIIRSAFRTGNLLRNRHDETDHYWFMVACQNALIAVMLFGVQVDVFHFPLKGWWLVAGICFAMYQITTNGRNVSGYRLNSLH